MLYWFVLACIFAFQTASYAQTAAPVKLEVLPGSVTAAFGESARVTVVAHVTEPVRNVRREARTDSGTTVRIGKPSDLKEGAEGDVNWVVSVTKSPDGRPSAKIVLLARYETINEKSPAIGLA